MAREDDREKAFSELVDRLLAGEETGVDRETDDDYRAAVEFAYRLARLGRDPSSEFAARLKDRLLRQLEQEAVEVRQLGWWERLRDLIAESPAWRTAVATAAVALVAVGVLWGSGLLTGPAGQAPAEAPAPRAPEVPEQQAEAALTAPPEEEGTGVPLQVEVEVLSPQAQVVPQGETVEIELSFKNPGSEAVVLAPYPPAVEVIRPVEGKIVRTMEAGQGRLEIPASQARTYTVGWQQMNDAGEQVEPGWYELYVVNSGLYKGEQLLEPDLSVGLVGRVMVQYPQGTLQKTIELDEMEMVGDVRVTLERLELREDRLIIEVLAVPPDYNRYEGPGDLPPPEWGPARAEYVVDGELKQAGVSGVRLEPEGVHLRWGGVPPYLDPVPAGADTVVVRVLSVGRWDGPWEFSVPLAD
jgi:hypothetical protein